MKKIILSLLLIYCSTIGFAQQSIFIASPTTTYASLTTAQKELYNKIQAQGVYSAINFVQTGAIQTIASTGKLKINLPFLFCNNMTFTVSDLRYTNTNNFYWVGKATNESDTNCATGNFTLMKNNGKFIGHLSLEDKSYELFDLTGGIQVICTTVLAGIGKDCGTAGTQGTTATTTCQPQGNCTDNKTKVLVLYTPAAAAIESDMNGRAALAINQLNQNWLNSGINNTVSLASVQPLSFVETASDSADVSNLAVNITAQTLRNQYMAEIVVLLTAGNYVNAYGRVKNIEASCGDAYAIVEISKSTSSRYTFAHEVSHLYGARHSIGDVAAVNNKGYDFKTGTGVFGWGGKHRATLMSIGSPTNGLSATNGARIEHTSSPSINYLGVATGDATHDNATKVSSNINKIADFYQDPIPNATFCILNRIGSTCLTGQPSQFWCSVIYCANVTGYTYTWFASPDAFTWTQKAIGNNIPITFTDWDNYVKCEVKNASGIIVETLQRTQHGTNGFGNCFSYSRFKNELEQVEESLDALYNSIKIYPNPTEGKIAIDVVSETNDVVTLNIYDLNNKAVYTQKNIALTTGLETLNLNLELQSGLYTLKIQGQTTNYIEKLIIQ